MRHGALRQHVRIPGTSDGLEQRAIQGTEEEQSAKVDGGALFLDVPGQPSGICRIDNSIVQMLPFKPIFENGSSALSLP